MSSPALHVFADVAAHLDGGDVRILADGRQIDVTFPTWPVARRALHSTCGPDRSSLVRLLHDRLADASLQMRLKIGTTVVGFLGQGARPGISSKLLGLAPLQVRPMSLLAAWWSGI